MNLAYTHKLLLATQAQPMQFLKVEAGADDDEVRLMVKAGLVDAVLNNTGQPGSFTAIIRITAAGEAFLRAFRERCPWATG